MTRRWCVTILSALLFLIVGTMARAATITVDTLADTAVQGHCSVRDAITAANSHAPVRGCMGGPGSNTIEFANGLSGTITLGEALPDIHSDLSIIGPDAGITISGNNTVPIIFIDSGSLGQSTVALSNLAFIAANYESGGGAINNNGELTVDNCTFTDNKGNNGGAILSVGKLTVRNSTFSGNNALNGGALALTRSLAGSTTTVINSTFYRNGAGQGGAIIAGGAALDLSNSTFSDNDANTGGALFSTLAKARLRGNIFAGTAGENCAQSLEAIVDEGYNISNDGSCEFSATGSHNNTDPALDPGGLADNGGQTQTIALEAGSPAVNQIPARTCPATDQREYLRPAPGQKNCDIGAFELNAVPAPSIDCSAAKASQPNPIALPLAFIPEDILGVTNPGGPVYISITAITQDKPVSGGGFVCSDGLGVGTSTARVRANAQGSGGLIYTLGFTASDSGGTGSCSGAVEVCVQDLRHQGECIDTGKTFDSTKCGR
jgi:hypothetical protein